MTEFISNPMKKTKNYSNSITTVQNIQTTLNFLGVDQNVQILLEGTNYGHPMRVFLTSQIFWSIRKIGSFEVFQVFLVLKYYLVTTHIVSLCIPSSRFCITKPIFSAKTSYLLIRSIINRSWLISTTPNTTNLFLSLLNLYSNLIWLF